MSSFLLSLEVLKPLQSDTVVTGAEAVRELLADFTDQVLGEYIADKNVTKQGQEANTVFLIQVAGESYSIPYQQFLKYESVYDSIGNERLVYSDTLQINAYFWEQIAKHFRQISADNELNLVFNKGKFAFLTKQQAMDLRKLLKVEFEALEAED